MRLRTLIKILALGLAARAILRYRRDRRAIRDREPDLFARDPGDVVQGFDEVFELQVEPLDVDARSLDDVEAAQDLAGLEVEIDQIARDDDAVVEMIDVDDLATRDAGELYAQAPAAVGRVPLDDDDAFADGQNWVEALETSVIENGVEPEQELSDLEVSDDDLLHPPHGRETRDVPVADFGSGGRGGL